MESVTDAIGARIKELENEWKKAEKVDRERAAAFEPMVSGYGWKLYRDLLDARLQQLSDMLMEPAGGIDRCVALEYVKGAMFGLLLARDLPSDTIRAMKELRAISPEEDDDDLDTE